MWRYTTPKLSRHTIGIVASECGALEFWRQIVVVLTRKRGYMSSGAPEAGCRRRDDEVCSDGDALHL